MSNRLRTGLYKFFDRQIVERFVHGADFSRFLHCVRNGHDAVLNSH